MTTHQDILVESQADHLLISLNRPEQANALSANAVEGLIAVMTDLGSDRSESFRSIVLRGNGRHFCAGFDLSDIQTLSDGDLLWRFLRIEAMLQMIHYSPVPVIALAQGQVIGAGADLFAACSTRIAAPGARFKMPGWHFELALGTRRLTALIGADNARQMLLNAASIQDTQALEMGLANEIVESAHWPGVIDDHAKRVSTMSPFAVSSMLKLTSHDSRSEDIAAIVATAGRPGLKNRILAFQQRVAQEREARKSAKPAGQ
ncbi:MAG: enoyl-CoA hydratase/isomerase family protein [Burkholderiaceae bacterium]